MLAVLSRKGQLPAKVTGQCRGRQLGSQSLWQDVVFVPMDKESWHLLVLEEARTVPGRGAALEVSLPAPGARQPASAGGGQGPFPRSKH